MEGSGKTLRLSSRRKKKVTPPEPRKKPAPKRPEKKCPDRKALERLQKKWPELVEKMGAEHPLLRTDLLDSWPQELTDTTCVLGFDPEFAGEIQEVKKTAYSLVHRTIVEEVGISLKIDFVEARDPVRWSHQMKNPAGATGVPSGNLRGWERNPAIRQVLEIFHGDVRDVQK